MSNNNYGVLLNEQNIKFQRRQFNEMVRLLGINVKFYPIRNRQFTTYSELVADEANGFTIGVILTDHLD